MISEKPKVLGICGSIRSSYKHISTLARCVEESDNSSELNMRIQDMSIDFSNTDIAVAHALMGARLNGAEVEILSINNIFEKKHVAIFGEQVNDDLEEMEEIDTLNLDDSQVKNLVERVRDCDGVVLGTPVYFGDRSSVANKFLQLSNNQRLLKDKAFGVVSVGAKRNGGQETTNIYSLYEGLMQDCIVVGNGPPVAQYGGTLVGGDKLDVLGDAFGLKTAFGTGHQVAQLSKILKQGRKSNGDVIPLKLLVVLTMDTPKRKYKEILRRYLSEQTATDHSVDLTFLQLVDHTIYRCIACDVCPSPRHRERHQGQDFPYNCIVQVKADNMREIRRELHSADAVVLVGVNSHEKLVYRYQAFMERNRFIRREDFELTNRVIVGMMINEVGAINNPIHDIKVLTSYIRHNTFVIKPIEIIRHDEDVVYQDHLCEYLEIMRQIKRGREQINPIAVSYQATGYSNRELDSTEKERR